MKSRSNDRPATCRRHHRRQGFTLIELMIAVAIVGILAAIAYPSYLEQVRKSRRADAQAALLELTQFMERAYTNCNRYDMTPPACTAAIALPFTEAPKDGTAKFYDLSFASGPTQTSYTFQAAPKNDQSGDRCGSMRIDNLGVKTVTGSATDCWR